MYLFMTEEDDPTFFIYLFALLCPENASTFSVKFLCYCFSSIFQYLDEFSRLLGGLRVSVGLVQDWPTFTEFPCYPNVATEAVLGFLNREVVC